MSTDDAIAKAVESELNDELGKDSDFRPTPFPRPAANVRTAERMTRVAERDSHEQWLQLGEKLHDQAQERVTQLQRQHDDMHGELVTKARAFQQVKADLEDAQRKLALFRQRLGYGG